MALTLNSCKLLWSHFHFVEVKLFSRKLWIFTKDFSLQYDWFQYHCLRQWGMFHKTINLPLQFSLSVHISLQTKYCRQNCSRIPATVPLRKMPFQLHYSQHLEYMHVPVSTLDNWSTSTNVWTKAFIVHLLPAVTSIPYQLKPTIKENSEILLKFYISPLWWSTKRPKLCHSSRFDLYFALLLTLHSNIFFHLRC